MTIFSNIYQGIICLSKAFIFQRHAGMMVEFALVLPVILLLLIGGIDIARYIHIHNKLEKTIFVVGDMLSRHDFIAAQEMRDVFGIIDYMMYPFGSEERYTVIVSGIKNTALPDQNARKIKLIWQYKAMGDLTRRSEFGELNQDISSVFPHIALVERPQTMVLAVEIVYAFQPLMFAKLLPATDLHRSILFRPLFRH